jgi:ubiquinone/menaquinone biosynthesis C-methylase UbiE
MENEGYKRLAKYYDISYKNKDYNNEANFIIKILKKYQVKTILDAGCGTGTHMMLLEKKGFICTGLDSSQEMLNVAKGKVNGNLILGDMANFNLNKKFDSIICMFAGFNHLISKDKAINALTCFHEHLKSGGILLIDLHNPHDNGSKEETIGNIKRTMKWDYDKIVGIEKTEIKFIVPEGTIYDSHKMKIYSIEDIICLLTKAGFRDIKVYENYSFNLANQKSKNLEVVGIK